ncbi:MAG: alpha-L-fucosidase, partial [Bacteroidia bacterium]
WHTRDFLSWLYNDSPVKEDVVVNDRFAKGMPANHGDYYSSEYKDMDETKLNHPWEESRGIGGSYGFNRAEGIEDYNSSEELIHELIDIVSRGGNLLLNVGPTSDGRIPTIMQERLMDIGQWLEVNGEAIYNTRKSSVTREARTGSEAYFTTRDKELFCIFTSWIDIIEVNLVEGEIVKNVSLLSYNGEIKWELVEGRRLRIQIPRLTVNEIPCLYAWSLKIEFEQ